MTKDSVSEYDTDPNNNTDVGGIAIEGSDNVQNFDNALRQIMAHAKDEHNAAYSLLGDNILINGGFDINQRAVSGTVTLSANEYGHDRWRAGATGCTYTFTTLATGSAVIITIGSGTLQQVVENKNVNYGGTHCLNWTGTAQGRINSGSYGDAGLTAIAGQNGDNITVEFGTGTLYGVSLVEGSVPASYRRRIRQEELNLCKEYYEKRTVLMTLLIGTFNIVPWRVQKRSSPSYTISGPTLMTADQADTETVNITVSGNENAYVTVTGDSEIY